MNEKGKSLDNEYNDRSKTAKIQHDHAKKQLDALKNISNQTNKKLLSIQTNQNHVIRFYLIYPFNLFFILD